MNRVRPKDLVTAVEATAVHERLIRAAEPTGIVSEQATSMRCSSGWNGDDAPVESIFGRRGKPIDVDDTEGAKR